MSDLIERLKETYAIHVKKAETGERYLGFELRAFADEAMEAADALAASNTALAEAKAELERAKTSAANWKESHGRVVEGFAEVCEAVGVQFDAPEAVAYAINAKISNADHDKRAAESQLALVRKALEEIRDESEVHTKLNQERLCCKFQDIAARALASQAEGDGQ